MTCPKCGFEQPEGPTECGRCGVIFAKLRPPGGPGDPADPSLPTRIGSRSGTGTAPGRASGLVPATVKGAVVGGSSPPGPAPAPAARVLAGSSPGLTALAGGEAVALPFPDPVPRQPAGPPHGRATVTTGSPVVLDERLVDGEARRALLIGGALALAVSLIPFLNFVFSYLVTLIHEFGHCITGWLFGYPSIPAFDFLHGGGVTLHQNRHTGVLAIFYFAFGLAIYHLRRNRRAVIVLLAVTAGYTLVTFTSLHEILRLFMGHGAELIFAGLFLYRALSGEKIRVPGERPLYAFAGFFILFSDVRFAFGLLTSHERRLEYELAKGGGAWMDFSQIAEIHLGTGLTVVAGLFLLCCLLPPLLCLAAFRHRDRIREALGRLLQAQA